jgi:RNA recognition motif-containing protein
MYLKILGLPVNITKSDLDDLFAPYGTILITGISILIKIQEDQSIAYVELDKNQSMAKDELNETQWHGYFLKVDEYRAEGVRFPQP